jgi:DNA polymerase (family 10)
MTRDDVVRILEEIAVLLELKGENPFKSRAYQNAARALETLGEPLEKIVAENRLGELKGFGEAMQTKVAALVNTGRLQFYEDLKASVDPGLVELITLPGVGPKKGKRLFEALGVNSVAALEAACLQGRVAEVEGFGAKSQQRILEGIQLRKKFAERHRLFDALSAAEPILEHLRAHPEALRCSTAGSLRRWKEVLGDLDFVVSSKRPAEIIDYFVSLPGVKQVLAKGDTKASVLLDNGMQADLRVVSDKEFPFALAYFTGSKEHNVVLRQRAIERGLRLNEYGLFRSGQETRDPALLVPCATEEEIYAALGLKFVPPELREDRGEIAAAEEKPFPRLIEWTDLKGSLHNHSNWSDGRHTLDDIANHMRDLGLAYWAITDHSKSSVYANGLSPERLLQQLDAIARVNERLESEGSDFRLLTGTEVDILKTGLDFPDEILARLDVVVASLHAPTSDEAENTRRFIRAAQNPWVHMLGHPTGRLLLEREGCKVDLPAVIEACAETGTWIELNASPHRLDMDWRHWRLARSRGVRCVINCDAHRLEHAHYLRLGAGVARKGWLGKPDVINTLPLPALRKALAARRSRRAGQSS